MLSLKQRFSQNDDPTNHLDLESIRLNDGLKFQRSIIFASHDQYEFIQTLANHNIVLFKNGVIDRIKTYDEFLKSRSSGKSQRTFGKINLLSIYVFTEA